MTDYRNFPYAPLDGYKSHGQFITVGLFVEMHRGQEHIEPLYTIGEATLIEGDKVYPAARLIYLDSKGEHDAMRKLVGSFKQWTILKELDWFRSAWELWHAEWLMMQGQDAREWLTHHAIKSSAAATVLFKDSKNNGPGRPKKDKTKKDDSNDVGDDHERVVALRGKR